MASFDLPVPKASSDSAAIISHNAFMHEFLASMPIAHNDAKSDDSKKHSSKKSVEGAEDKDGPDSIPGGKSDKTDKTEKDKPDDIASKVCPDFKFKGQLFLIGGNADDTFNELIKKLPENPKVVVVTMASREPGQNEALAKDFEDAGIPAQNITVVSDEPAPAQTKYAYTKNLPANFDMIYFSGGDQEVLRQRFTEVDKLRQALENGAIVAGNSAGTAIMPCEMITGGDAGDLTHSRGFGLTPWAVTDTHVHQRNREDRDISALYDVAKGELPVIGIDADTRVIFRWDGNHLIGEVGGDASVRIFRKTDQDLDVQSNNKIKPTIVKGTDGAGKGKSANMWELKAGDKFILR